MPPPPWLGPLSYRDIWRWDYDSAGGISQTKLEYGQILPTSSTPAYSSSTPAARPALSVTGSARPPNPNAQARVTKSLPPVVTGLTRSLPPLGLHPQAAGAAAAGRWGCSRMPHAAGAAAAGRCACSRRPLRLQPQAAACGNRLNKVLTACGDGVNKVLTVATAVAGVTRPPTPKCAG